MLAVDEPPLGVTAGSTVTGVATVDPATDPVGTEDPGTVLVGLGDAGPAASWRRAQDDRATNPIASASTAANRHRARSWVGDMTVPFRIVDECGAPM